MGKTDNCTVLLWQGEDRGQLFMDTSFAGSILQDVCSPEAVSYAWMKSFAWCFHFMNFTCTHWQRREIPSGILIYSSLLTEGFFLYWSLSTHLVHSTIVVIWESKLQSRSRNREEFRTLKGLQNSHPCTLLEASQGSVTGWLCTYLQLRWVVIFV